VCARNSLAIRFTWNVDRWPLRCVRSCPVPRETCRSAAWVFYRASGGHVPRGTKSVDQPRQAWAIHVSLGTLMTLVFRAGQLLGRDLRPEVPRGTPPADAYTDVRTAVGFKKHYANPLATGSFSDLRRYLVIAGEISCHARSKTRTLSKHLA
jgi:hypothetical protein